MAEKDLPQHGRAVCRAMSEATGIQRIRTTEIDAGHDDVTIFRVEFIATDAQVKAFCEALARLSDKAA